MKKRLNQDYCTCVPDKIFGVYIGNVCYKHDLDYAKKPYSKKEADLNFRESIYTEFINHNKKIVGWIISRIYYLGVVIFGYLYWN